MYSVIESIVHLSYLMFWVSSSNTYVLHSELLSFMLVAMSTQLLSGSSPGPDDVNPFIDAAMSQVSDYDFPCNYKSIGVSFR